MSVYASAFGNVWSQILQIKVILIHLKLWVTVALHNFTRCQCIAMVFNPLIRQHLTDNFVPSSSDLID